MQQRVSGSNHQTYSSSHYHEERDPNGHQSSTQSARADSSSFLSTISQQTGDTHASSRTQQAQVFTEVETNTQQMSQYNDDHEFMEDSLSVLLVLFLKVISWLFLTLFLVVFGRDINEGSQN